MAVEEVSPGVLLIHGKEYQTVAKRIADFREDHPNFPIRTRILTSTKEVVRVKATIKNEDGVTIATGHAEEMRGVGNINRHNALENAETGAVGRALAMLGRGGTAIPTAEDMIRASEQADADKEMDFLIRHNKLVLEHFDSIAAIKEHLEAQDYYQAYECIKEIPTEDFKSLWRAQSKGGIWTPAQRAAMKSNEMNEAKKEFHND